jgi:hypothetical protein
MASVDDWTRLGEAVTRRRAYLGYTTRQQFADGTGFPAKTLSDLEKHRRDNFDRSTYGRLERALQWPNGAIESILAGGPVPFEVYIPTSSDHLADRAGGGDVHLVGDVGAGKSALSDVAVVALASGRDDEPDPLDAKLERVQLLDETLNPTDRRRLRIQIDVLLEWMHARGGVPEMSAEEPRQLEGLQRVTRAGDEALREREAEAQFHETVVAANAEQRREPAMRKKQADR